MTLSECEDIVKVLKARARIDGQFGLPAAETLAGKAAEAIEWLMKELDEADDHYSWLYRDGGDGD